MDGGQPLYVLITIDDYHRLVGRRVSIVDLISADEHCGTDFEPNQALGELVETRNVPDFSGSVCRSLTRGKRALKRSPKSTSVG